MAIRRLTSRRFLHNILDTGFWILIRRFSFSLTVELRPIPAAKLPRLPGPIIEIAVQPGTALMTDFMFRVIYNGTIDLGLSLEGFLFKNLMDLMVLISPLFLI